MTHATPAASKVLAILDNLEIVLAIELVAAAQAYDLQPLHADRAGPTEYLYQRIRRRVPHYRDDQPMNAYIDRVREIIRTTTAGLEDVFVAENSKGVAGRNC